MNMMRAVEDIARDMDAAGLVGDLHVELLDGEVVVMAPMDLKWQLGSRVFHAGIGRVRPRGCA